MVSREYKYLDPGRAGLFAATVPPAVSKLLCVWALKHGHEHFVADISDAFLNVDQDKKLSVLLPGTKQWVLLWKMLPGQRAAAANWADHIAADVKSFGFKPCRVCPTVFVKDGVALAIHVDDLYVTGKCAEVEGFLNQLEMKYRLKKSGPHGIGDSFYFLKRRFAVTEFGICVTPNPKYKTRGRRLVTHRPLQVTNLYQSRCRTLRIYFLSTRQRVSNKWLDFFCISPMIDQIASMR